MLMIIFAWPKHEMGFYNTSVRPLRPTVEFLIEALGVQQGGWHDWSIDELISRHSEDPDVIDNLISISDISPYGCQKAGADYILFRLRIAPKIHLRNLIEAAGEQYYYCAIQIIETRLTPEDDEFTDIILSYRNSNEYRMRPLRKSGFQATYSAG